MIKELDKNEYSGIKYSVNVKVDKYLDIIPNESGFKLEWKNCKEYINKLEDEILSGWLDDPVIYGYFIDDKLIGFVEGYLDDWNNRFRISNIIILDENYRKKGIGKELLNKIIEVAKEKKARMAVLETQSYNYNAIKFYERNGFEIIGFDRYAYTNNLDEHNIRIEMGMIL